MATRKLTYSTAQKIRQLKEQEKLTDSQIIKQLDLNIARVTLYKILKYKTYKTLKETHFNPIQKLDNQKVREIKGLLRLGRKPEWIAVKFNVSHSCIQRIKYGLTWAKTFKE